MTTGITNIKPIFGFKKIKDTILIIPKNKPKFTAEKTIIMLFTHKTFTIFTILLLFVFFGCQIKKERVFEAKDVQSNFPEAQTRLAAAAINNYLSLKNALVATDNAEAGLAAGLMYKNIDSLHQMLLTDTSSIAKRALTQVDSIHFQLKQIILNNNKDCEPQRIYFKYLSDNLLSMLVTIRIRHLHLYDQYCPLALNEKGGP